MEMKYIVISDGTKEEIVIFPKEMDHDQMFAAIKSIRFDESDGVGWTRKYMHTKPVSAGFTNLVNCYGKSESLKLKCRVNVDTALLNR